MAEIWVSQAIRIQVDKIEYIATDVFFGTNEHVCLPQCMTSIHGIYIQEDAFADWGRAWRKHFSSKIKDGT
jgi:hypothetical protein